MYIFLWPSLATGRCRPLSSNVVLHCPGSMVNFFSHMVCARDIAAAERSLFRVTVVRTQTVGAPQHLNQSRVFGSPAASTLLRHPRRRGAMAPATCQHSSHKLRPSVPAGLALAWTAAYNKAAQRIAFGVRRFLR